MPSSTSSFSRAIPPGRWPRVWLLAAALTAATLAGEDLAWRAKGYPPVVTDDMDLWALWRDRVDGGGPDTVVLLGASRMQVGFDLDAFKAAWPNYRVVQLSVDGRYPVAALRDLADDEKFGGVVICSILEPGLLRQRWDEQRPYVDYYHAQWTLEKGIGRQIRTALQQRLVILNPDLNPRYLVKGLFGKWPKPPFLLMFGDRCHSADYRKMSARDLARHAEKWARGEAGDAALMGEVTPEQWLADVEEVERIVRRIQARGGRVVFTRYVTSGRLLALQEASAPRAKFWDVFAARTSAVAIHFQDLPALSGFVCPEDSHLDFRDAREYTRRLCDELGRRGVLRPGGAASQSASGGLP